jgi:hypothetical protein
MNHTVLYVAAAMTGFWGLAHLSGTRGVVKGFGNLTPDNRRIITMEWIVEGVCLISTAAFVLPFRLCPFIFGLAAALIAWGAWF